MIRCGDIEKEYTLLKEYPVEDAEFVQANTLIENGKIVLRGHSFGDSKELVTFVEGEPPSREYPDTLNTSATTLLYKDRSFLGYDADIEYTFENDKLYRIEISANAFLITDDRRMEAKDFEVSRKLADFGEPFAKAEVTYTEGYVTQWQDEQYHIFMFVYPSGFSFIAEQQSCDLEQ